MKTVLTFLVSSLTFGTLSASAIGNGDTGSANLRTQQLVIKNIQKPVATVAIECHARSDLSYKLKSSSPGVYRGRQSPYNQDTGCVQLFPERKAVKPDEPQDIKEIDFFLTIVDRNTIEIQSEGSRVSRVPAKMTFTAGGEIQKISIGAADLKKSAQDILKSSPSMAELRTNDMLRKYIMEFGDINCTGNAHELSCTSRFGLITNVAM